jgi:hypothetical protein
VATDVDQVVAYAVVTPIVVYPVVPDTVVVT